MSIGMNEQSTPTRRPSDVVAGIIDVVIEHALAREVAVPEGIDLAAFTRHYYRNAAPDDLRETPPERLADAVISHLQFIRQRTPGTAKFRVFVPQQQEPAGWYSPVLVVELVNDDMPFLVSTAALAVQHAGLNVRMTVHPVISVRRDEDGRLLELVDEDGDDAPPGLLRESLVHLQLARDIDDRQLIALLANLSEGMADLRLSINDWRPMRDALTAARDELADSAPPVPDQQLDESLSFLQWMNRRNFTFFG